MAFNGASVGGILFASAVGAGLAWLTPYTPIEAFGLSMLILGRIGQKRLAEQPPEPTEEGQQQRRGH